MPSNDSFEGACAWLFRPSRDLRREAEEPPRRGDERIEPASLDYQDILTGDQFHSREAFSRCDSENFVPPDRDSYLIRDALLSRGKKSEKRG